MPLLTEQDVNIYEFPHAIAQYEQGMEISIGDLHGNSMKLLFVLFKHGIASGLRREEYKELSDIYIKSRDPSKLKQQDIGRFNQLLGQIRWKNGNLLRLIGDETADRGNNDYFTLKIFEAMGKNNVPFEILFSNHGLEFIRAFNGEIQNYKPGVEEGQAQSLQNLQYCFRNGLIEAREVQTIIDKYYKPNLKCASCAVDNDNFLLFTHAPAGLENIRKLSGIFGVTYSDTSRKELASTIQQINAKFQAGITNKINITYQSILFKYVWERDHGVSRPLKSNGFEITYVHGHDSGNKKSHPTNVVNLDNYLGKFSPGSGLESHNTNEYEAFSNHDTLKKPEKSKSSASPGPRIGAPNSGDTYPKLQQSLSGIRVYSDTRAEKPIVSINFTYREFVDAETLKTGTTLKVPETGHAFHFQYDGKQHASAILTRKDAGLDDKPIANQTAEKRQQICNDVICMIQNVLAKSTSLHITTKDPYVAAFAKKYIAYLTSKKNLEFQYSVVCKDGEAAIDGLQTMVDTDFRSLIPRSGPNEEWVDEHRASFKPS